VVPEKRNEKIIEEVEISVKKIVHLDNNVHRSRYSERDHGIL